MRQFLVRFADEHQYTGHLFRVEKYHIAEPTLQTVWLLCITDPSIKLNRYVRMNELVKVDS